MEVKKHLEQMSFYPSLLVSSTAKTALMEIEKLEGQVRIARFVFNFILEGYPANKLMLSPFFIHKDIKQALDLMDKEIINAKGN